MKEEEARRGSVGWHRSWVKWMYGGRKQKMMNSTRVIFVSWFIPRCKIWHNAMAHAYTVNPNITKSLPSWVTLVFMRWQRQKVGRSSALASSNTMMWERAIPDAVVITRWWQCQPLGQPAAAFALWISQIKAASNLLWSVRGCRP